jgi:hypothetical protein
MCTASWLAAGEGFHLLFNRDERRNRPRGLAPRPAAADGVRYLAPVDALAGGTWIACNERGMLFALLNRTDEGALDAPRAVSRGSVIPSLIAASDAKSADEGLAGLDLRECAPFRLIVRDGVTGRLATRSWNGLEIEHLDLDPERGLLCSSGLGDARVTAARTPQWERLRESGSIAIEALRAFHRSHLPEPSADSVCMHRDDAETVSHVELFVDRASVTMRYIDGSPCRNDIGPTTTLELRR